MLIKNIKNYFQLCAFFFILALGVPGSGSAQDIENTDKKAEKFNSSNYKGLFGAGANIAARQLASGDIDSTKKSILSLGTSKASSMGENFLSRYFPTVEFDLNLNENNKPVGGLLLVAPLFSEELENTFFTQASLFRKSDRSTVNIGLGYRRLEYGNKLLLGLNGFYDHEFPYHHSRASIGFEARTTVGELNINIYRGLTGWKTAENSTEEQGLGGYDIELGIPLPYINWSKLYFREFKWKSAIGGEKDISGRDLSLNVAVPFLTGLVLEAGHRDYKSQSDENFLKMSYNISLGTKAKRKRSWLNKAGYTLGSMKDRRLDKVRRENLIYKQKRVNGVLRVGGF